MTNRFVLVIAMLDRRDFFQAQVRVQTKNAKFKLRDVKVSPLKQLTKASRCSAIGVAVGAGAVLAAATQSR
jgi:hypothetical protein